MSKTPHGIMFHHFHDEDKHIKGQGSISAEEFSEMLDFISENLNILGAEEFLYKSENDKLEPADTCITFDDGLLCQYDIANPVLKKRNLTAFWFVYTSPMEGVLENLEIYRHFRFSMFADVEDFYASFFNLIRNSEKNVYTALNSYNPDEHYIECPFYTPNDKRFRYLRDDILGPIRYNEIMDRMISDSGYDISGNSKLLWMNQCHIKGLSEQGNIVGLHSHTHPTVMDNLSYSEQKAEYEKNKACIENATGYPVISVSYPCNSYNDDTLRCMQEFGIKIGFRANMGEFDCKQPRYEYPREDHANILEEMRNR